MVDQIQNGGDAAQAPKRKFTRETAEAEEAKKEPTVRCRVTRRGGDKISTGLHVGGLGDETYAEGEVIELPLSAAKAQQDELDLAGQPRGYVEILGYVGGAE